MTDNQLVDMWRQYVQTCEVIAREHRHQAEAPFVIEKPVKRKPVRLSKKRGLQPSAAGGLVCSTSTWV